MCSAIFLNLSAEIKFYQKNFHKKKKIISYFNKYLFIKNHIILNIPVGRWQTNRYFIVNNLYCSLLQAVFTCCLRRNYSIIWVHVKNIDAQFSLAGQFQLQPLPPCSSSIQHLHPSSTSTHPAPPSIQYLTLPGSLNTNLRYVLYGYFSIFRTIRWGCFAAVGLSTNRVWEAEFIIPAKAEE